MHQPRLELDRGHAERRERKGQGIAADGQADRFHDGTLPAASCHARTVRRVCACVSCTSAERGVNLVMRE